ncbi:MAG: hypothetical protein ACTSUO_05490, partial [Candidatus Thorarchaeota archaeon]
QLASYIDPDIYQGQIEPRINRYLDPPRTISVSSSEPWLNNIFMDLAGPPYHVHELNLYSLCPFAFYFYQFLYNLYGNEFDRERIPPTSKKLFWRYGPIPKQLAAVHLDSWTTDAIRDIINNQFRDRSKIVTQFSTADDFASYIRKNAQKGRGFRLAEPFAKEYSIIFLERSNPRDWKWVSGGVPVDLTSGSKTVQVILPPHRIDNLAKSILIISYINYSNILSRLILEKRDAIRHDPQKTLPEYTLPILLGHYSSQGSTIAGAFFIELYENNRLGYFKSPWATHHHEYIRQRFRLLENEWDRVVSRFTRSVINLVDRMTPKSKIEYIANTNECDGCVYRTLCMVGGARV